MFNKASMVVIILAILGIGCQKEENNNASAQLNFEFAFDANQIRLNGFGQPVDVPPGHAAQSPEFNSMSVFYIELVPDRFTQLRDGAVVYEAGTQAAESGGIFEEAVIFDQAIVSGAGNTFLSIPFSDIPHGTYRYLRVSVTYQNYRIKFNLINNPPPMPQNLIDQSGTIANFIGFNTYISDVLVGTKPLVINADRQQGFWAFEPEFDEPYQTWYIDYVNPLGIESGQVPTGSITVVNPLAQFGVELPFGSCVVTGALEEELTIHADETTDKDLVLSFSVNKSFEWEDQNANGQWDSDVSSGQTEKVVDMGLRGLIIKQK